MRHSRRITTIVAGTIAGLLLISLAAVAREAGSSTRLATVPANENARAVLVGWSPHRPIQFYLTAAADYAQQAVANVAAAQKANALGMHGHAAKAKALVEQALAEINQAEATGEGNR